VDEPLRFVEVLTTASAVANYLGQPHVTPQHVLDAIAVLLDEKQMEDVGPMMSPLIPRRGGAAVAPEVQDLAQRWFARLGGTATATLSESDIAELREELTGMLES